MKERPKKPLEKKFDLQDIQEEFNAINVTKVNLETPSEISRETFSDEIIKWAEVDEYNFETFKPVEEFEIKSFFQTERGHYGLSLPVQNNKYFENIESKEISYEHPGNKNLRLLYNVEQSEKKEVEANHQLRSLTIFANNTTVKENKKHINRYSDPLSQGNYFEKAIESSEFKNKYNEKNSFNEEEKKMLKDCNFNWQEKCEIISVEREKEKFNENDRFSIFENVYNVENTILSVETKKSNELGEKILEKNNSISFNCFENIIKESLIEKSFQAEKEQEFRLEACLDLKKKEEKIEEINFFQENGNLETKNEPLNFSFFESKLSLEKSINSEKNVNYIKEFDIEKKSLEPFLIKKNIENNNILSSFNNEIYGFKPSLNNEVEKNKQIKNEIFEVNKEINNQLNENFLTNSNKKEEEFFEEITTNVYQKAFCDNKEMINFENDDRENNILSENSINFESNDSESKFECHGNINNSENNENKKNSFLSNKSIKEEQKSVKKLRKQQEIVSRLIDIKINNSEKNYSKIEEQNNILMIPEYFQENVNSCEVITKFSFSNYFSGADSIEESKNNLESNIEEIFYKEISVKNNNKNEKKEEEMPENNKECQEHEFFNKEESDKKKESESVPLNLGLEHDPGYEKYNIVHENSYRNEFTICEYKLNENNSYNLNINIKKEESNKIKEEIFFKEELSQESETEKVKLTTENNKEELLSLKNIGSVEEEEELNRMIIEVQSLRNKERLKLESTVEKIEKLTNKTETAYKVNSIELEKNKMANNEFFYCTPEMNEENTLFNSPLDSLSHFNKIKNRKKIQQGAEKFFVNPLFHKFYFNEKLLTKNYFMFYGINKKEIIEIIDEIMFKIIYIKKIIKKEPFLEINLTVTNLTEKIITNIEICSKKKYNFLKIIPSFITLSFLQCNSSISQTYILNKISLEEYYFEIKINYTINSLPTEKIIFIPCDVLKFIEIKPVYIKEKNKLSSEMHLLKGEYIKKVMKNHLEADLEYIYKEKIGRIYQSQKNCFAFELQLTKYLSLSKQFIEYFSFMDSLMEN